MSWLLFLFSLSNEYGVRIQNLRKPWFRKSLNTRPNKCKSTCGSSRTYTTLNSVSKYSTSCNKSEFWTLEMSWTQFLPPRSQCIGEREHGWAFHGNLWSPLMQFHHWTKLTSEVGTSLARCWKFLSLPPLSADYLHLSDARVVKQYEKNLQNARQFLTIAKGRTPTRSFWLT